MACMSDSLQVRRPICSACITRIRPL